MLTFVNTIGQVMHPTPFRWTTALLLAVSLSSILIPASPQAATGFYHGNFHFIVLIILSLYLKKSLSGTFFRSGSQIT